MLKWLSVPIAELFILIFLILFGIGMTPILREIAKPFKVKELHFESPETMSQEEKAEFIRDMQRYSKEFDSR